ncbi:22342_t:CDS:2, partial [Gigaspora margarita]
IILKPPPCLNVSLRWQESQIEDPTRKFIKNIMDLKVSTEWSFTATIKKLEPAKEKVKNYDWSSIWKKIKGQCGVRCTSMAKNRKLAILIKCMNGKLPLIKTLARRRPDLYVNPYCIYLKCEKHRDNWDIVESNSISIAWSTLSKESILRLNKKELGKILWGVIEEKKILRRAEIIKGLTQEKVKRQLYDQLQSSKEARKLLEVFVNTAWNGFFTEI